MKLSELFETAGDHVRWVVGNLGSNGLLLKSQGTTLKLDYKDADALVAALKANDEVVIKSNDNKQYRFVPDDKGFVVNSIDDEVNDLLLTPDDVKQVLDIMHAPDEPTEPAETEE